MGDQYKLKKELFVSNHNGGTIGEINVVTLVAPVSVFLWSVLQAKQSLFTPYTWLSCLVDFLLNCAAILFVTTFYSSQSIVLNALLLAPALLILPFPSHRKSSRQSKPPNGSSSHSKDRQSSGAGVLPIKPFITAYRGTMLVVTCVAILAVDFQVFPRRFAKVENWGTSLMDLGVGSFVFSAGTVAARPIVKEQALGGHSSLAQRLITALRHGVPLLILGLIRLYSVKGLEYAEHVTEYGVHWNFFFTLAFIQPFVAIFDSMFALVPSYALFALILATVYQVILESTELTTFIVTAPRTDLLSQNREGIFSLIGYLAIFLAGQGTGTYVLPHHKQANQSWLSDPIVRKLSFYTVAWTGLLLGTISYSYGASISISRRLCNLPYVLWINAFNCGQLLLFYVIELICFHDVYNAPNQQAQVKKSEHASSKLLRAFNRNGLAIFLLANLLTGLVNMTMPTLDMGDLSAMGVLLAYLAVLSGMALVLDAYQISIKL